MTGAQFRYEICGLAVDSAFRLDEAYAGTSGESQVRIRRSTIAAVDVPGDGFRSYAVVPEGDLLQYRDVGRFLIEDGSNIVVDLEPGFDERLVALPLLGPVLALLLHRRRRLLVLHGSAVEIGGQCHVFLGDKGAGKSTTAAALVAAGFPLIADDTVALDVTATGEVAVLAAYPAMKLDEGILERFGPDSYHVLEPNGGVHTDGKLRVRLHQDRPGSAVPLGHLHCLQRGQTNVLSAMNSAQTLQTLIRFTHFPRLGNAAMSPAETAAIFILASRLAPRIRADYFTVKDDLTEISTIGRFLMEETGRAVPTA